MKKKSTKKTPPAPESVPGPEQPLTFSVSNCNFTGTGREASAAAVAAALGDNARALAENARALGELAKGLQGPMVQFG